MPYEAEEDAAISLGPSGGGQGLPYEAEEVIGPSWGGQGIGLELGRLYCHRGCFNPAAPLKNSATDVGVCATPGGAPFLSQV